MPSRQMVATPSIELMGRAAVTLRHYASREDIHRMRLLECISLLHVTCERAVSRKATCWGCCAVYMGRMLRVAGDVLV